MLQMMRVCLVLSPLLCFGKAPRFKAHSLLLSKHLCVLLSLSCLHTLSSRASPALWLLLFKSSGFVPEKECGLQAGLSFLRAAHDAEPSML